MFINCVRTPFHGAIINIEAELHVHAECLVCNGKLDHNKLYFVLHYWLGSFICIK